MVKKKSDKKIECFSASFNNILICQRNDAKPFIEVFVEDPENITQQNLGILAGILEITDSSEDSSYIVNYLISVIKKEYYAKPKRGVIESFESALKKANLALAKLAEHENIAWIGHTNAILLVIDKNNLHLSQSGSARALLLRGKTLTDISEDPTSLSSPNPIKTFTDIVSGRLEENDKLIVTTESMFDLFSLEEIKRSALKFSSPEFIQFLKTALINEAERAAALVIEIRKETKLQNAPVALKNQDDFNAFSQSAFSKKSPAKIPLGISAETFAGSALAEEKNPSAVSTAEREMLVNDIKEELAKDNGEFVDKKTGHIYIKGNSAAPAESPNFLETLSLWQDKLDAYSSASLKFLKTLPAKSRRIKIPSASDFTGLKAKNPSFENDPRQEPARTMPSKKISLSAKASEIKNHLLSYSRENFPKVKLVLLAIISWLGRQAKNILRNTRRLCLNIYLFYLAKQHQRKLRRDDKIDKREQPDETENYPASTPIQELDTATSPATSVAPATWLEKRYQKETSTEAGISKHTFQTAKNRLTAIMPNITRLKNLVARMDYSQRIYTALAIVCLFVIPYFLAKIGAKPTPKTVPVAETVAPLALAQDKSVTRVEKINSVYAGEALTNIINLNDAIFGVSAKGIVDVAGQANYPFPDNFVPVRATGMDDINFLFILGQDNRVIAWSPVSKKFQDNAIDIPAGTKIASIGTYLTYLYILDSAGSQIYRYPRDTGGFGAKTDWLKGTNDLSQIKNMAIGENLYLGTGDAVTKFFQGKKQDFTLEKSATPIVVDMLYTKRDAQFLYILDKTNARIIKADLNGQIITQYYNTEIKNATDFALDEKNNNAYVSTASGASMFQMN